MLGTSGHGWNRSEGLRGVSDRADLSRSPPSGNTPRPTPTIRSRERGGAQTAATPLTQKKELGHCGRGGWPPQRRMARGPLPRMLHMPASRPLRAPPLSLPVPLPCQPLPAWPLRARGRTSRVRAGALLHFRLTRFACPLAPDGDWRWCCTSRDCH